MRKERVLEKHLESLYMSIYRKKVQRSEVDLHFGSFRSDI